MCVDRKYIKIRRALDDLVEAKRKLRECGVLRSERFVGEIGEWFVKSILEAKRAETSSQKGWDLLLDGKKIQVKTHAKGDDNNARWTEIKYDKEAFDELIVVIFTKEFHLKEFYRIPINIVMQRIVPSGKQKIIKWDDLNDHQVQIDNLPHQEITALFRKPRYVI